MVLNRQPLDIVATNIAGLGAVQLAESLIPALEAEACLAIERIYLPNRGPLSAYRRGSAGPLPITTARRLPNAVSRLVECTIGGGRFAHGTPLLVLGDLPLRVHTPQTLVVQTPHLLNRFSPATGGDSFKYSIMRRLFRANVPRVAGFIVQSAVMRDALLAEYPIAADHVHIIQQPPPSWLLATAGPVRAERMGKLRLFYPAAGYPHKNHTLLAEVDPQAWDALVDRLVVTLPAAESPNLRSASLACVGCLAPGDMCSAYADCDALVFLSTAESYGFPLVEAMWLGLPVIAPDLAYARSLCGADAIYFNPRDAASLVRAVADLAARLACGWRPDWRTQLAGLPRDWAAVAKAVAAVVRDQQPTPNPVSVPARQLA